MADLQRTVALILRAEDYASSVFATVGNNIEDLATGKLRALNDSVESMTQPFADLAAGVLKVDAALGALVVGGLSFAFAKSAEFEAATIDLKKVLGDFPELLGEAQTEAKDLAATYGESATSVLGSMANFKQAGFEMSEAMGLTKAALDLVIAGDIDAAQASDLLISSLKGFKEPASEAARLVDILNEVSNNYATDVQQLAIGMAELSPIAETMGFSMEETAGVLTPVIEIFRSGGEAAIALKTGLLRLIDDNPTVVRALESIGIAQRDSNGELRSGKDILADVGVAFTTLDENQKLFVASQLVGIEQAARMVTVFDNLGKTSEITATALGASGSAALEVAARLDSAEIAVNRFQVGFTGMAVAVGDQFREAAKEAINGGTAIETALTGAIESGALDSVFDALESELDRLGRFLGDVAEALPEALEQVDFKDLLNAIGGVGSELEGLFDGIDLSTTEGLAEAIQLAVDSLEGLANVTSGMVGGARPFIEMLGNMVEGFAAMSDESQRSAGEVTGFAGALNLITGPVGKVLSAVEGLGTAIQTLAGVHVAKLISSLVGTGGMTSALSGAASAAGGLIASLAGPAGVAAVVGASALSVGTAVKTYLEWQDAEDEAAAAADRAAESAAKLADKFADISAATGVQITSIQDLQRAMKDGQIVFDESTKTWQAAGEVQRDYAAEVEAAKSRSVDLQAETLALAQSMGLVTDETEAATLSMQDQKQAAIDASAAYYEFIGNPPEVARRMAELEAARPERAMENVAKAAEEASKKTEEFLISMEEIASNERIKTIELAVELDIAKLESDTKKFESIMDSINTTIDSTGTLIGTLFGEMNETGDMRDKWAIRDQIDEENRRRDAALQLQKDMTEAQIALIEAKTKSLENGDALIKITADGLEPEIEAFMWQILERIQVRVAEEQAELLLGV